MIEISGKIALVTGGGSGIGRGLALALAAEGAAVVVGDIIAANADKVADEIKTQGGRAIAVTCDVSDRTSVQQMKTAANSAFGTVSLLFANAGATAFDRITDMRHDDVDWILQVNLMGVSNCLMAFLPDMLAAGSGHVVATASMAGLLPGWIPYHAPYSGAKLGVVGLMMNLRAEAADRGVGISVLCPGSVPTAMGKSQSYRPDRFGGPSDDPIRKPEGFFASVALAPRSPEEVAQFVLQGVRNNRPVIVTDGSLRKIFMEGYVNDVLAAFDDIDEFDRLKDQSKPQP